MKRLLSLSLLLTSLPVFPSSAEAERRAFGDDAVVRAASPQTATCVAKGQQSTTSVTGEPFDTTTVDFMATGFDPAPLLSTTMKLKGEL